MLRLDFRLYLQTYFMSVEPFYPIATAEKMIADFSDCSLPPDEWDHGTHLVMGLFMIAKYEGDAYERIKQSLIKYTGCLEKEGYHETMTGFWIWAIQHFRGDENGNVTWDQEALDGIIFDDNLTRRNLWTDYYSKELMMSDEARNNLLKADLKPMQ